MGIMFTKVAAEEGQYATTSHVRPCSFQNNETQTDRDNFPYSFSKVTTESNQTLKFDSKGMISGASERRIQTEGQIEKKEFKEFIERHEDSVYLMRLHTYYKHFHKKGKFTVTLITSSECDFGGFSEFADLTVDYKDISFPDLVCLLEILNKMKCTRYDIRFLIDEKNPTDFSLFLKNLYNKKSTIPARELREVMKLFVFAKLEIGFMMIALLGATKTFLRTDGKPFPYTSSFLISLCQKKRVLFIPDVAEHIASFLTDSPLSPRFFERMKNRAAREISKARKEEIKNKSSKKIFKVRKKMEGVGNGVFSLDGSHHSIQTQTF